MAKKDEKSPAVNDASTAKKRGKTGAKGEISPKDEQNSAEKTNKRGKQKKAHVTRPTPEEEIKIAERRSCIWGLKKSGASVRDIQAVLLSSRGEEVSVGTIHSDIHAVLSELQADTTETAKNWQTLAKEQCKDYQMAVTRILKNKKSKPMEITEAIKQGNNTIKTLIEIGVIERPPKEIKINVDEVLASIFGCDPDELPDSLEDE